MIGCKQVAAVYNNQICGLCGDELRTHRGVHTIFVIHGHTGKGSEAFPDAIRSLHGDGQFRLVRIVVVAGMKDGNGKQTETAAGGKGFGDERLKEEPVVAQHQFDGHRWTYRWIGCLGTRSDGNYKTDAAEENNAKGR
jgi:hypothetical protein